MEPIEVRRIAADEWEALRDVRLESLTDSPAAFISSVDDESKKSEAEWRIRTAHTVMAFRGSRSVGVAAWVRREPESSTELVGMWVAPAERGSGTADALVDAVRQGAPSDCTLELEVQADNARAIRFYARCGFEVIDKPADEAPGTSLVRMRLT